MTGRVTYEITADVREDLRDRWERYMIDVHIPDLLATGCFAEASIGRNGGRYRIRYEAHDRAALDRYLAEHAPRLRADALAMFPAGVDLQRAEWDILAVLAPTK